MFTTSKKPQSVVGLDIETGSIAATEISTNGSRAVSRTAIAPLRPGIVNEGEVLDTEALSRSFVRSSRSTSSAMPCGLESPTSGWSSGPFNYR